MLLTTGRGTAGLLLGALMVGRTLSNECSAVIWIPLRLWEIVILAKSRAPVRLDGRDATPATHSFVDQSFGR